ncbi:MAG: glycine cleavage system aminomethyltransferase GcvT [Gammaproteobacteria bacterium]|nr:glycine cleavage system aminomethyltransferase GcvT [Gammaproteobacteria bacterium]
MGKKTPLYDCHLQSHAKIVDFAGWDMPLHYGSQLQEHHQVRQDAGLFDVSHMTIIDVKGSGTATYLRKLLANNIDKLTYGQALYTCMLDEQGGIIDDLIVYKISDDFYRLVVNSGTHDKDVAWLTKQAQSFKCELTERTDLAMLAIQGPKVREKIPQLFNAEQAKAILALPVFYATTCDNYFIARTGYTGEEGFEIILSGADAPAFWQRLLDHDIKPCGLGARDTLRLEAGLNLYGADMDESVSPLVSNLAWTIGWEPQDRSFIGRSALEEQKQKGVKQQLVGLILEGSGVLRNHQKVIVEGLGEGEITSGSFSPSLGKGIALARVPVGTVGLCQVEMRGKLITAQVIKPPFIRHGKKTFSNMMERENE